LHLILRCFIEATGRAVTSMPRRDRLLQYES
jgi:hypothetical protein